MSAACKACQKLVTYALQQQEMAVAEVRCVSVCVCVCVSVCVCVCVCLCVLVCTVTFPSLFL
jgi:hypothetical protein